MQNSEQQVYKWYDHDMIMNKNWSFYKQQYFYKQFKYTCTTGVPKFSGSVRGRWSRV